MIILFVSTTVKFSICARRESFRCHEDVSAIVGNPVELYNLSRIHTELYARPSQQNEKWFLPKDRHDRFLQYLSTPLCVESAPVFFSYDVYTAIHTSFQYSSTCDTMPFVWTKVWNRLTIRLVRQFQNKLTRWANDNDILSFYSSITRLSDISYAIGVCCL